MGEDDKRHVLAHALRVTTMGHIVASIVHELRQPLTAVLANAQAAERFLACDPPNTGEVLDILGDIIEDDRRAGEVIRRLWSLLEAGRVEATDVDLNQLVVEVFRIVGNDARLKDVTLESELVGDPPTVRGDRIQIQQVLLNLVMNGIEAMGDSNIADRCLVVRTMNIHRHGAGVEVTDRGTGIDPARLDRVFEPYYTTRRNGLGMGLSIAKSIVEAHGGRLTAVNNPESGATFRFTLPLSQ